MKAGSKPHFKKIAQQGISKHTFQIQNQRIRKFSIFYVLSNFCRFFELILLLFSFHDLTITATELSTRPLFYFLYFLYWFFDLFVSTPLFGSCELVKSLNMSIPIFCNLYGCYRNLIANINGSVMMLSCEMLRKRSIERNNHSAKVCNFFENVFYNFNFTATRGIICYFCF